MRRVYFDTSAYVKIFNQEAGSDIATLLFELAHEKRVQILMSIWVVNEAFTAVDRLHRRQEIRDDQRAQILASMIRHTLDFTTPSSGVLLIPTSRELVNKSKDIIIECHVSADDALHLYTAFAMDCECFVYRDDKLKRATGGEVSGMKLLDITDNKDMNPLMKTL